MATASTTVILTWTVPTTRLDSSVLDPSDITGAAIHDSGAPIPGAIIGTVTGITNTFTTGALNPGTHNLTVVTTTKNTTGNTSAASNSISVIVPVLSNPSAITDLVGIASP